MGMTLQYQGSVNFPAINTTLNLNAQPVQALVNVNNKVMYSDETGANFRKIAFVSTAGVTTPLIVTGITNFKQTVEETVVLDGDTPVLTVNNFNSFTVVPQADIGSLSIGNGIGTTDFIGFDGTPTTHMIVKRGTGSVNYTVYGLNTFSPMNTTELALQRYTLDPGLTGQTGSTTTAIYVPKGGCRFYIDVTTLTDSASIEWWISSQSII
jgi:hypothetical protein